VNRHTGSCVTSSDVAQQAHSAVFEACEVAVCDTERLEERKGKLIEGQIFPVVLFQCFLMQ
jgi:hypothetical protein